MAATDHAPLIAVCGHLCLDIIPGFPAVSSGHDYFRPGRLSIVEAPVMATGGAVSNVGISLHRLGLPARLAGKVGDDPFGRIIRERVDGMGGQLGRGIIAVPRETTSYTVVLNPPGVDRIFLHCPGANDTFTEGDVEDSVLEGAAIFHFGYPPLMRGFYCDGGRGLARIFHRARGHGAVASLDMSLPDPASESGRVDWADYLSRVLPEVDIFVPSVEELLFMIERPLFDRLAAGGGGEAVLRGVSFEDLARIGDSVLAHGVSALMIKLGDRGAYLRTAQRLPALLQGWEGRELYTPVFSVRHVAGTTGAGDATIAGFLASACKGLSAERALTMAVAVGGCCVEAPDATSGILPWEATEKRVSDGWAKAPSRAPAAGWKPGEGGIWRGPGDRGRR